MPPIRKITVLYHANDTMTTDSAIGLEKNSVQVERELIEVDPEGRLLLDPVEILKRFIQSSSDALFLLNTFGLDTNLNLLRAVSLLGKQSAVWFIDNPFYFHDQLLSMRTLKNFFCFEWDRFYIPFLREMGIGQVIYLPQATNPERFRPLGLSAEEKALFDLPLTFAGNLDLKELARLETLWLEENPGADEALLQRIIGGCSERVLKDKVRPTWKGVAEYLEELKLSYSLGTLFLLNKIVEFELSVLLRIEMVRSLKDFPLSLWGDEAEWGSFQLGLKNRGRVSYFKNMPKVFNGSGINLNISRIQQRKGTNQRVFDVPACKAFVLTDYKEELEELFDLGKDIVTFRSFDDLKEKIRFFSDPSKRSSFIEQGHIRVLSTHTYVHRMGEVLKSFAASEIVPENPGESFNALPLFWIMEAMKGLGRGKEAALYQSLLNKHHSSQRLDQGA